MVSATFALMRVMNPDPNALNMTAMMTAARGVRHRVDIAVAIALGASVQPLTKMTPRTRIILMTSAADTMKQPLCLQFGASGHSLQDSPAYDYNTDKSDTGA